MSSKREYQRRVRGRPNLLQGSAKALPKGVMCNVFIKQKLTRFRKKEKELSKIRNQYEQKPEARGANPVRGASGAKGWEGGRECVVGLGLIM